MEKAFKAGDIVRLTDACGLYALYGQNITPLLAQDLEVITGTHDGYWFIDVRFRDKNTGAVHVARGIASRRFDLVEEEKGTYVLISRDTSGKLTPAVNPREFTSKKQAKKVLAEMCARHPGMQFKVFKEVAEGTLPMAEPVIKWGA